MKIIYIHLREVYWKNSSWSVCGLVPPVDKWWHDGVDVADGLGKNRGLQKRGKDDTFLVMASLRKKLTIVHESRGWSMKASSWVDNLKCRDSSVVVYLHVMKTDQVGPQNKPNKDIPVSCK